MGEQDSLYPAWRAAHGALVYRDVRHGYGPSVFYLNAALLRLGGDDLLAVRLGLLVVKAAIAGLIFHLARLVASRGIALVIAGLFVAVWSAPLWIYATPYASHYAILAGFAGVAILLARPLGRRVDGARGGGGLRDRGDLQADDWSVHGDGRAGGPDRRRRWGASMVGALAHATAARRLRAPDRRLSREGSPGRPRPWSWGRCRWSGWRSKRCGRAAMMPAARPRRP